MEAVATVKSALRAFEGKKGVKRRNVDPLGLEALLPRVQFDDAALRELVLWDRYLGAAGATSLADALKANSNVKKLVLRGNEVDNTGVQALAGALSKNQNIKSFHFKHQNHYNDFVPLGKMLEQNSSLTDLSFCGNTRALGNYTSSVGIAALAVSKF